jgi:hypothetical protein
LLRHWAHALYFAARERPVTRRRAVGIAHA